VTKPGVYDDFDETAYHADPALSSSGARRILPPWCPAKFKWERDNGRPEKRNYDFGHAAHKEVLGVGMEIVIVQTTAKDGTKSPAADLRTKSAQQHRDDIYAEGKVPLLVNEVSQVMGMAAALRANPAASGLINPSTGRFEVSLFWPDTRHNVDRRARIDYLPEPVNGRIRLVDYKTCISAEPFNISKSVGNYGYHQQAAWYIDGIRALGLAEKVDFLFIFQEKYAPYLTTVVELDEGALLIGRARNERALEVFAQCVETDAWPSYTDAIETVSLPAWAGDEDLEVVI
jgi:hypothetical protein